MREQLDHLKVVTNSLLSPLPTTEKTPKLSGCSDCTWKWIGCIIQGLSVPLICSDPKILLPALYPVPQVETYNGSVAELRFKIQEIQNKLNEFEPCRKSENDHSPQFKSGLSRGPHGGRGGMSVQGGRGNERGGVGSGGRFGRGFSNARPCEPPQLLIPVLRPSAWSATNASLSAIKDYRTRYERGNEGSLVSAS